jgi:hypothetical protein
MVKIHKPVHIKAFISKFTVKAFNIEVLNRLARDMKNGFIPL